MSFLCVKPPVDPSVLAGMKAVIKVALSSVDLASSADMHWVVVALRTIAQAMPELVSVDDELSRVDAVVTSSSHQLWESVAAQGAHCLCRR